MAAPERTSTTADSKKAAGVYFNPGRLLSRVILRRISATTRKDYLPLLGAC